MIDKHTFKICEAVALGLTHYYMGYNDKRKLTEAEIAKAKLLIPALPTGWMHEKHEWDAFAPWDKRQKKKTQEIGKAQCTSQERKCTSKRTPSSKGSGDTRTSRKSRMATW